MSAAACSGREAETRDRPRCFPGPKTPGRTVSRPASALENGAAAPRVRSDVTLRDLEGDTLQPGVSCFPVTKRAQLARFRSVISSQMLQTQLGGCGSQDRSVHHRQPQHGAGRTDSVLCLPEPTHTFMPNRCKKLICYFYRVFPQLHPCQDALPSRDRGTQGAPRHGSGERSFSTILGCPRDAAVARADKARASSEKNLPSPAVTQHHVSGLEEQGKPSIISFGAGCRSSGLQKAAGERCGTLPYVSCCPTPILCSFWCIFGAIPLPCLSHPVPSPLWGTE